MEVRRLDATLAARDAIPADLSRLPGPVVVRLSDADVAVAAPALGVSRLGVWVAASAQRPAALIARDVKTLSHLLDLTDVVVEGPDAPSQAEVVEAMLTDDEVSLKTPVATLTHAYNRPAPPRPVAVWSYDGAALRRGGVELRATSTVPTASGTVTVFS
ncbi:MAG TPA: hypothetical protein VGS61_06185 [Acidimicrobiales bacterium]|nr:hypothetical protein [Acidimicrobiales bacterium]